MNHTSIIDFNAWKRTEAERSIIFCGGLAGSSNAEIDARLAEVGARPLCATSYKDLVRVYVPYFLQDMSRLAAAIKHPPTRSEVSRAMRRSA